MSLQPETGERFVQGNPLKCPVCGHDQFRTRRSLMNRRWLSFFEFAWADRQATCEICGRCGHVLWFLPPRA